MNRSLATVGKIDVIVIRDLRRNRHFDKIIAVHGDAARAAEKAGQSADVAGVRLHWQRQSKG